MGARLTAALLAGRAAAGLSRRFGFGGGTVISGHIVRRVAPNALAEIVQRLPEGSILVSGTNGKTTTSRLIAQMLRASQRRPLHNRAGANLLTGLVSAVVEHTSLAGVPRADIGLFEVDEATLPTAIAQLQPRLVVLTNIFRDQLDRYGEVQFIYETWRQGLQQLPAAASLVLNADDPLVAALGEDRGGVITFGIDDHTVALEHAQHAADARLCLRCGARYQVERVYYGHLGHYRCSNCGVARPQPQVVATGVTLHGAEGTDLRIETPSGGFSTKLRLPGLYNVYNVLAASAAAVQLGVRPSTIAQALETFTAAFGRLERVAVEDRQLFLALVKNPVGFNEVLRTIVPAEAAATLVIVINDHFADGTDVSWLWDVDFELLRGRVNLVVCSGTRAEDLAVRLKYADIPVQRLLIESEPRLALERALAHSDPGDTVYVLPTYTAMLEVRDVLRKTGYVGHFYED